MIKNCIKTIQHNYVILSFQIVDGQLHFVVSQYGKTSTLKIGSTKVSDGDWHNVTVTIIGMFSVGYEKLSLLQTRADKNQLHNYRL